MREVLTAAGCTIFLVLLVLGPRAAAAQSADYPLPNPFGRPLNEDLAALDAFDGRSRVDRFSPSKVERPIPWRLYGRLGPLNFLNPLDPYRPQAFELSWRRTGPALTGKIYIGIHRTF